MVIILLAAHTFNQFGIIRPYQQVLNYNKLGRMVCHSATKPIWSYSNHFDFKATHGDPIIPHSMTIGDSLLITRSNKSRTRYFCDGTYPNGSYFLAQAHIYRGSKYIILKTFL